MKLLFNTVVVWSLGVAWAQPPGQAQAPGQVKWTAGVQPSTARPGSEVLVTLTATLDRGWHMYSASTAAGIRFSAKPAGLADAVDVFQAPPVRAFDKNFNVETETYAQRATFLLKTHLRADQGDGASELQFNLRYQTCNDRLCVPGRQTIHVPVAEDPSAPLSDPAIPAGFVQAGQSTSPARTASSVASFAPAAASSGSNGIGFLLIAFGFGFAAVFTPCVFPMIPITVSYFLNQGEKTQRRTIFQATIFCLGIVALFSGLGALTTALLGPFGVVQLGSSPWVNGFIALVFLVFGLSMLGAFELTMPSSLLTTLGRASNGGGILGTLAMGLTFALASFACIGPFMGTLLAASVQRSNRGPILGMLCFACGLALPFFALALFPAYLKRLPRSGGWMSRVKIVMGFVILGVMLKYVSNVDQVLQWGLLTRELFLAAWIVLSAAAGLYLLGFLRLEGINKDEAMGVGRLLMGLAFLIFALTLQAGVYGGRLGALDAYIPAASEGQPLPGERARVVWLKDRYKDALETARREHRLVLASFSGYACTNCHWMQANMFNRPEVAGALSNFVLVELHTDGTDAASEENQKLEQSKFGTVAIPFYAILDGDEHVRASFPGLTHDPREYLKFLSHV
ncbi:MAG: cytochrome c biogenesis protein CcdA [Bryobacteraceae bacterium]